VAQESREADIAATREELERLRVRAAAEIEAEKSRAIADLRAEVPTSPCQRPDASSGSP
jgi:F0F1-type ATP synthase membrane subunit b/b'